VTLRKQDWKTLQTALCYFVYRYTQMYIVNKIFHNKALTGIVVYISCSCALDPLSICAFTLHIRQTLATFPDIHFPPQLVHLSKICKFMFLSIRCKRAASFSILICLELWNVTDHIRKTTTLSYLILGSHSERQNKMAHLNWKFYIQFSEHNAYWCVGVGEKLNIRKRREQKGGKRYIKSSFMICTAYRIVLVDDINENEMGKPCSTYSGYNNKNRV